MRKLLTLCLIGVIALSSMGVNAFTKEDLGSIKEMQHTGLWFDKDTQQTYYFENGYLSKDKFIIQKDSKFYVDSSGILVKGWKLINGNWYHFKNSNSNMEIGWIQEGSNWYYLNSDGVMAHDTTIDGYNINSNGTWVK